MLAVCLCGSYESSGNLHPPSQGNLAHDVEGSEHSNKLALRYYGRYPGEILGIFMTRNIHVFVITSLYRNKVFFDHLYCSTWAMGIMGIMELM